MKHIQLTLLILLGLFLLPEAKAQTDPSPTQTICFGTTHPYRVDWNGTDPVTGTPGSSYVWSVTTPGFTGSITPTSASGNSVSINWGTTPAAVPSGTTYTLQVVETNAGCSAPAISMNVLVIPLPTVIVGANQSICQNTISAGLGGVI